MKIKTVSNRELGIAVGIAILFGIFLGWNAAPRNAASDTLAEQVDTYKAIKEVDDRILYACGDSLTKMSEGMDAFIEGDIDTLEQRTNDILKINSDVQIDVETRKQLLKQVE